MAAANSLRLIAIRSVSPGTALAPAGGTMNIQIRLPGVLLLACLGVAASLSPAAAQTIASGSNQTFGVGQPSTAMSPITVKDAATPTVKAAKDIRIRIPSTFNMTWNTALTTATITGSGAGKVATTVTYEDAGHTLVIDATSNFAGNDQIVVSGLEFASFTAVSAGTKLKLVLTGPGAATRPGDPKTIPSLAAPSATDNLELAIFGPGSGTTGVDAKTIQIVAPTLASAANQVFVVGQAPTAMAAVTITDAATATITTAKDLRVRIPATSNMSWNTALTTATIGGG